MTEFNNNYDKDVIESKKLSGNKWNSIEKPLSEEERARNLMIISLGENILEENNLMINKLITIGDYYYELIRDDMKQYINLPEREKKVENKKKITKMNQLILNNNNEVIKNNAEKIILILKDKPENKIFNDLINNTNYIEFRILILMKIIDYYINTYETNIRNESEEILIGSKKIINLLKNIRDNTDNKYTDYFKKICNIKNFEIDISNVLIEDLEYKINEISKKVGVEIYDISNRRPKLIYDTIYDDIIPNVKLKPYESQIELAEFVKNNIDKGFLIFYKTLPGLGKTSMILSICSFIKKSKSKRKVIFCCSDILESVRIQVLRIIYNFQIKFGIATFNKNDTYKITNSWNCKKDEDRELIVADYKSTYLLLKENKNDYFLFFDEPTVLTDSIKNTNTLKYLSLILYYLPSHVILSSATLPIIDEFENIINHFKNKYPNGIIKEIVSNKTLLGSFIKDYDSNIVVPHINCKKFSDLKEIIKIIKNFPLLGKFYTLPFLMNLNIFCEKHNIGLELDKIETFNHDNILENILLLLDRISELKENKKTFNEFINIKIQEINEDVFDIKRLDVEYNKIVFKKLLTGHAYKYLGCCLIATNNPNKFAIDNLYEIVDKLKEKVKVKEINKEFISYKNKLKEYDAKIEKIKAKYNSENIIDEHTSAIKKPVFKFNKSLEINTENHIKSFAKYVKECDMSMLKNGISQESINIDEFNIDDNLKFLLYMGVGIFCKGIDDNYTNKVLEMLNDRELAYIIADESFCYGANYLISNVIITDEIGDNHSINTILQLIGRTARIGKSWSGKVYLDNNTCNRIKDFFINPSFLSVEGSNIVESFNNIISYVHDEEEKEKLKEIKIKEALERNIKLKNEIDNQVDSKFNDIESWVRGKNFIKTTEEENQQSFDNKSNDNNSNDDNSTDNNIWIRGKTFKISENDMNDVKVSSEKSDDNNEWIRGRNYKKTNNSEENKLFKVKPKINEKSSNNEENLSSDVNEWKRGVNHKKYNFVPKSLNELKKNKSNFTNVINNVNNNSSFEDINMFKPIKKNKNKK